MGQGFDSWASLVTESVWGTAPGSGEVYARLIDETVKLNPSPKFYPGLSGPGRRAKFMGHRRVAGEIKIEPMFQGGTLVMLLHAFGSVGTAGTGPYTHTYAMTNALPVGLNIELSKADTPTGKVFRYDGAMIDSLTIDFAAEEMLTFGASVIAKDRTTDVAASGSPSFPADEPMLFHHSGQLTVVGSAVSIKSGSLTIANNLDADRFFMSQLLSRPKRKGYRDVTGTALVEFEDLTLVDKFALGTQGTMSLSFTDASANQIAFTMAASFLSDAEPVISGEGTVEMPVNFQAIGGNTEFVCVVTCDQAVVA